MTVGLIDPNWVLTDLDPLTWRHIGRYIEPAGYIRASQPGERGLYILHDGTKVCRVVDEHFPAGAGLTANAIGPVHDPAALAHELFAEGHWDRVHVIDKRHLANVARDSQRIENRVLTLDQYYRHVAHLIWGSETGYVCVPAKPPSWNGWTYDQVLGYVDALPERASVALGVFDQSVLYIGLVIELTAKRITRVTTFEALKPSSLTLDVSAASLNAVMQAMTHSCHPPAAALLCTLPEFERWLKADDKAASLNAAMAHGQAIWAVAQPGTATPAAY